MAGRKLTLFEIHLDDATFSATKGGELPAPEAASEADEEEGGGCRARRAGRALLVIGLLAAVAVVAAKALGGGVDEDLADLADLDAE
jgi:hypothetical protein